MKTAEWKTTSHTMQRDEIPYAEHSKGREPAPNTAVAVNAGAGSC